MSTFELYLLLFTIHLFIGLLGYIICLLFKQIKPRILYLFMFLLSGYILLAPLITWVWLAISAQIEYWILGDDEFFDYGVANRARYKATTKAMNVIKSEKFKTARGKF